MYMDYIGKIKNLFYAVYHQKFVLIN